VTSRRTVILIIAVALGAFAALGLLSYVRNAETEVGEAGSPVEVWVAKAPIPKGTPAELAIEQNLIGTETVAQRLRPATAVVDPDAELAGLVAITDLPANMALVSGSFVSPSVVKTGITDRLAERGLVTVTLSVDQVRGAAYLIEPGDFVNVMTERAWPTPFYENVPEVPLTDAATAELTEQLEENDTTRPIITDVYQVDTRMVYQKAEVLAVGEQLTPDLGESAVGEEADQLQQAQGIITLAVPPEAAQTILNVGRDNLYLSLVPDDYVPRAILPQDPTRQVLPGEADGRLTPYEDTDSEGSTAGLAFSESSERIGSPAGGSGAGTGTGATNAPTDVPPTTTPATTTPSTTAPSTTVTTAPSSTSETTSE